MLSTVTTPYNAAFEAFSMLNQQCIDFTAQIWKVRASVNLSSTLSEFVQRYLNSFNVVEMSLSEFRKMGSFQRVFTRDLSNVTAENQYLLRKNLTKVLNLSMKKTDVYVSPLYKADIETISNRYDNKNNEIAKNENKEPEPPLEAGKCININTQVLPLPSLPDEQKGVYTFISSCFSQGPSKFLKILNRLLAFGELQIIETGASTGFMIYKNDRPYAIFKPTAFAGGSIDNPKRLQFDMVRDDYAQAAIREFAAFRVMGTQSGVPETRLVEINLGGKVLIGSLQKYVEHDLSVSDLLSGIQIKIAQKFGFNIPASVLSGRMPSDKYHEQLQHFKHFVSQTSFGKYHVTAEYKEHFERIKGISHLNLQGAGLHQLISGNPDPNGENYLLTNAEDGVMNFTPVDFNSAFSKRRVSVLDYLEQVFWRSHPFVDDPIDPSLVQYFKKYNVEKMADQLRLIGLDEERVLNFILRTTIVKQGVLNGLTLFEISNLFIPSRIEGLSSKGTPLIQRTLSQELIEPLYPELDKCKTKPEREELLKMFRRFTLREIKFFASKLKEPKSFEYKMHHLRLKLINSKSLEEYDRALQMMNDLIGLHFIMPYFQYASRQEIAEDNRTNKKK